MLTAINKQLIKDYISIDEPFGPVVAGVGVKMAEELIESSLSRDAIRISRATQMPFARHECLISSPFQQRGHGDTAVGQESTIARLVIVRRHRPHARLMRIEPCQQRSSGRTTSCRIVHLRHAQPATGHGVKVRCPNLSAVTAQIGVAEIIGKNEEDVWALVLPKARNTDGAQRGCQYGMLHD